MKGVNNVAIGEFLGREHGNELDVTKRFSYGVNNSAKGFIDERAKTVKLGWRISNDTAKDKFLVISSLFDDNRNSSIFEDVREMLTAIAPGVDALDIHAFQEGVIQVEATKELKASSTMSKRSINQFLRFTQQAPTRITDVRLESRTTANAEESGNLTNEFRTVFFSPFADPIENQLALAPLVQIGSNFNKNVIDIDFVDQAFPVILSNEHFWVIQVNKGTVLTMTVGVGAQNSLPQEFFRSIRKADDLQRTYGLGK